MHFNVTNFYRIHDLRIILRSAAEKFKIIVLAYARTILFCVSLIIFAIALFLFQPPSVLAQENNKGLTVSPAFVDITLEKVGEEQKIELDYINHTLHPVNLEIFPLDFKQQDENGQISFVNQTDVYSYSLSSFLSFESRQLTLNPKERKTFTLIAKNRDDLSPGGHYAAIIAKIVDTPESTSSGNIIQPSISSLILLRKVGGERFNLSLSDTNLSKNFLSFSFPKSIELIFQNQGNIHLVPYGKIEFKDILGRITHKGTINQNSVKVFPEGRRRIKSDIIKIKEPFPIMIYTINIAGQDSLKKTTYSFQESYIYINTVVIFALFFIFIALFIAKKLFKK